MIFIKYILFIIGCFIVFNVIGSHLMFLVYELDLPGIRSIIKWPWILGFPFSFQLLTLYIGFVTAVYNAPPFLQRAWRNGVAARRLGPYLDRHVASVRIIRFMSEFSAFITAYCLLLFSLPEMYPRIDLVAIGFLLFACLWGYGVGVCFAGVYLYLKKRETLILVMASPVLSYWAGSYVMQKYFEGSGLVLATVIIAVIISVAYLKYGKPHEDKNDTMKS